MYKYSYTYMDYTYKHRCATVWNWSNMCFYSIWTYINVIYEIQCVYGKSVTSKHALDGVCPSPTGNPLNPLLHLSFPLSLKFLSKQFDKKIQLPVIWAQTVLCTWQFEAFNLEWCFVRLSWVTQFSDSSSVQAQTRKVKTAETCEWLWSCSFQVSGCENTRHRACDPGNLTQPEHALKLRPPSATVPTAAKTQVWSALDSSVLTLLC